MKKPVTHKQLEDDKKAIELALVEVHQAGLASAGEAAKKMSMAFATSIEHLTSLICHLERRIVVIEVENAKGR